jgi:hypothetical protein
MVGIDSIYATCSMVDYAASLDLLLVCFNADTGVATTSCSLYLFWSSVSLPFLFTVSERLLFVVDCCGFQQWEGVLFCAWVTMDVQKDISCV